MIQHETFDVGYAVFAVCLLAAVRRTLDIFIGTARIVCGAGSMKAVLPLVRLSVPAWAHSSKPAAAILLLWASGQEISIDCCSMQQRHAAGECGQCHVVSVRQ